MLLLRLVTWAVAACGVTAAVIPGPAADSDSATAGVEALVKRRLPHHAPSFQFELVNATSSSSRGNDSYLVSSEQDGSILIQGNTLSALLSGYVHSIYCFIYLTVQPGSLWTVTNACIQQPSCVPHRCGPCGYLVVHRESPSCRPGHSATPVASSCREQYRTISVSFQHRHVMKSGRAIRGEANGHAG
jgi:alpha-N-acetylglucosaminidase